MIIGVGVGHQFQNQRRFPLPIPDVGYNMSAYDAFQTVKDSQSQWVIEARGDSITRAEFTSDETTKAYAYQLKSFLGKPDGGDGFISSREGWYSTGITSWQTLAGPNGGAKRASFNLNADGASVYSDTSGVTGFLNTGGFGGEYIRMGNGKEIRFRTKCSRVYVLYMDCNAGAGGKASFMVDGVAAATNIGDNTVVSDTPRVYGPIDMTSGQHTISIKTTSGNFNTIGIVSENGSSGVIVNRVGRESWKAADWATRANVFSSIAHYAPDVPLIAVGTNDVKDQTVAAFKTNTTTIAQAYKAIPKVKAVGIIIMPQMSSGWANYTSWPTFVQAMKEVCTEQGCFGINLYDAFGPYATAQSNGLFARSTNDFSGLAGNDVAHWSNLGHEYAARCIAKLLV